MHPGKVDHRCPFLSYNYSTVSIQMHLWLSKIQIWAFIEQVNSENLRTCENNKYVFNEIILNVFYFIIQCGCPQGKIRHDIKYDMLLSPFCRKKSLWWVNVFDLISNHRIIYNCLKAIFFLYISYNIKTFLLPVEINV